MNEMLIEFAVVFFLILLNGFFSGSELAIISAKKSTISRLAAAGSVRAKTVEALQSDPHRFLATIQIGISMVGSLAAVLGGNNAAKYLKPVLDASPYLLLSRYSEAISTGIAVAVISYLTLIFGELAPKTVGLQYSDRIAMSVAKPISLLAAITGPVVRFLTLSNRLALRMVGVIPGTGQDFVTREEILHTVAECGDTGVITNHERKVIENMLDFGLTTASEVMVPRLRMVTLSVDAPREELLEAIREHCYTRYPAYSGNPENVIGFLHSKDLLLNPQLGTPGCSIDKALRPLHYVPENQAANLLLRTMQQDKMQMALVVDEYGSLSGLVTIEDLLEELVGDICDEYDEDEASKSTLMPDGSLIVNGDLSRNDLEEILEVKFEEGLLYDTIAGLILHELGHLPGKGEEVLWRGYRLVCEDVTPTCIKKVKIVADTMAAA